MEDFFQPRKVSIDYSVSHLTVCVTSGLLLQPTVRGTLNRGGRRGLLIKEVQMERLKKDDVFGNKMKCLHP